MTTNATVTDEAWEAWFKSDAYLFPKLELCQTCGSQVVDYEPCARCLAEEAAWAEAEAEAWLDAEAEAEAWEADWSYDEAYDEAWAEAWLDAEAEAEAWGLMEVE